MGLVGAKFLFLCQAWPVSAHISSRLGAVPLWVQHGDPGISWCPAAGCEGLRCQGVCPVPRESEKPGLCSPTRSRLRGSGCVCVEGNRRWALFTLVD